MRNFIFGVIKIATRDVIIIEYLRYFGYSYCAHFDPEQENLIHFSTEGSDAIDTNHKDYLSTA